jgi:hypothetical protein
MKPTKMLRIALSAVVLCFVLTTGWQLIAQSVNRTGNEPIAVKRKGSSGGSIVIGYVQTRDRVITISRDSRGSVYTVKNKDGKTLAAGLREKDFEAKFPALHDQVKNGFAGNDASLRSRPMPVIDASR